MDGRGPGRRPEAGERPLTRRELRAAAASTASASAAAVEVTVDVPGPTDLPPEPDPALGPVSGLAPDPADLPDLTLAADDLRWPPTGASPSAAPVDRSGEPARLPDEPVVDRRPWADSGLWGGAPAGAADAPTEVLPPVRSAQPADRTSAVPELPPPMDLPFADLPPVADPSPLPSPAATPPLADLPTLHDLLAARPAPADGPAERGWRGTVRRLTGGLVAPSPGAAEQRERAWTAGVQRPLDGPRTVVVVNPKGGAHKTTATLLLAATFGGLRGGYTLAWDNNETRGTLGWRARHTHHARTAVDLLGDLDRFADPAAARVGDLDAYVRAQTSAKFDVLASDEDAASAASVDGAAFRSLHRTLQRFYRVLVVDTGNNMRASNWQAAVEAADQVVVVSTMREDTAQSAAWMLDALRATGKEDVVRRAVTVLSQPAPRIDAELTARLHDHFGRLTRTVLEVPYEPALVAGGPVDFDALSTTTRRAWLRVAAAVADGL